MAKPATRQELIDYCKRRLGAPVLEINVDDDQIEDLVDDTFQYFNERHFDGVERMYLKHKVTQEEIDQAKNDLDERTFQQEYLATFVNYAGVIYYNFDRNKHIIDTYEKKELPLHIGMDFNYNPMACCIGQIRDNNLIIFDEIQIYNANTNDMIDEIKRRYGVRNIVIYPDPASRQRKTSAGGFTDLSLLRNAGFEVKVRATHPQVRDRINAVNSKLKNAKGVSSLFMTKSCKNLIKSLERQIYKEGTHIPDKDSGHDHMADAIGYLVEYVFPLRRDFKPSEPTRWS